MQNGLVLECILVNLKVKGLVPGLSLLVISYLSFTPPPSSFHREGRKSPGENVIALGIIMIIIMCTRNASLYILLSLSGLRALLKPALPTYGKYIVNEVSVFVKDDVIYLTAAFSPQVDCPRNLAKSVTVE